jgi:hypothetical protein
MASVPPLFYRPNVQCPISAALSSLAGVDIFAEKMRKGYMMKMIS